MKQDKFDTDALIDIFVDALRAYERGEVTKEDVKVLMELGVRWLDERLRLMELEFPFGLYASRKTPVQTEEEARQSMGDLMRWVRKEAERTHGGSAQQA